MSFTESIGQSFCTRYNHLYQYVDQIPDKIKREITRLNHVPNSNEHLFLVSHGLTLGEYNLLYFLIYCKKRKTYQEKSTRVIDCEDSKETED